MKIASVTTIKLKVPLNKPMRTRYIDLQNVYCLLLIIKTDTGITGQGLVRATNQPAITIIENFIKNIFSSINW